MNELIFCNLLAAVTITGAVESQPGWMTINYIDDTATADYMTIPMAAYLQCYPTDAITSAPFEE
jgi:hypothetical protein